MIKNIVFDMGGVIVDVQLDRAIRNFKNIGVADADELIDSSHHKGIFIDFENGEIDTDEFCRALCEHANKFIPRKDIEDAWRSMIDPPLQYKSDFVKELRRSYKLYLLTNNNPIIMDWARSEGFAPDGSALSDCFDKIYVSYEMKCTKPDLTIFRKMIEDAGIMPEETLYIDDSAENCSAAETAGLTALLVENGSDWREKASLMLGTY
ncbi:MAG: HAD family phosphatase [Tannerella sp.]|jgi:putative hydrolase of the HAD superfamily|nr:HAD family phosphatase [Tannerella sp.]